MTLLIVYMTFRMRKGTQEQSIEMQKQVVDCNEYSLLQNITLCVFTISLHL